MKDKIKEIILSVNPGMDVEDEDFNSCINGRIRGRF